MSKADKLLKRVEFYEKMASSQKPENDNLLKKASLFEKLALYSDRKSFLTALGGGATSNWGAKQHSDADIKGALQRVVDATVQWNNQYGDRLVDASGSPRTFPRTIAQDQYNVAQAARLPSYDITTLNTVYKSLSNLAQMNNKGFQSDALQAWAQSVFQAAGSAQQIVGEQISALEEWKANIPPDQTQEEKPTGGDETMVMPADRIRALPPINIKDQQAVFDFVRSENLYEPKTEPDGKLGKDTRNALNAVKDYFVKTYPRSYPNRNSMSDAQAITAAKAPKR
jgi:hypothetical protein